MTKIIDSVLANTVVEVADIIDRAEWMEVLREIESDKGEQYLLTIENNITILDETGNVEGMLDYVETLADKYNVEF